jgi:hypothetical protein
MSCPYLENGHIPRCHALSGEKRGMRIPEGEPVCFSGDFSDCGLLVMRVSPQKSGNLKGAAGIGKFPSRRNRGKVSEFFGHD